MRLPVEAPAPGLGNGNAEACPLRCLLITSIFPPIHGGSGTVYEALCRFAPRGSMHVLTAARSFETGHPIVGTGEADQRAAYPVHRIELLRPVVSRPASRLHSLWRVLSVDLPLRRRVLSAASRIVEREGIQVVCIGELLSGGWLGVELRRRHGCRLVFYIHGEEITTESPWRRYGRDRAANLAQADGIVAVSRFTRDELLKRMHVDPSRITVIENGVDCERFRPAAVDTALASTLGLAGKRILLSVGRLVLRKGFDMTLRALPRILQDVPEAHYLIAGVGEARPELQALVQSLGLGEHVTFAGRVPDERLADYYRLAEVFLMPNRELDNRDTEGFGLVFLEANACGRAVIGGRAGGAVEAVHDGVSGVLVDGNSAEAIADATLRLLRDDAERRRLEQGGLGRARAASSRRQAERFHHYCRELCQGVTPHAVR